MWAFLLWYDLLFFLGAPTTPQRFFGRAHSLRMIEVFLRKGLFVLLLPRALF